MEAVSDALRLELRQWGIHVCLVDPGGSRSAIFDKTLTAIDEMAEGLHGREIEILLPLRLHVNNLSTDHTSGAGSRCHLMDNPQDPVIRQTGDKNR